MTGLGLSDEPQTAVDGPRRHLSNGDDCPECDGTLVTAAEETRCGNCGLIVAVDPIDRGPEWRSYGDKATNRDRTGAPLTATRHDRGLTSEIGFFRADTARKGRRLARMRRENRRGRFASKAERTLGVALGEIARLTSALGMTRATEEIACTIYRRAQGADLIVGRSIEMMATASVYAACRCGPPIRSLEAVTAVAKVPRRKLELGYRVLNRELELPADVARPRDRVGRLADQCEVSDKLRYRALEIAEQVELKGIASGCHPAGVAAACLYRAGREHGGLVTQAQLAAAADVSARTVRKRTADLNAQLE